MSGPTARARLAGSVHGVVVQASIRAPASGPSSELEADGQRRVLAVAVDVVHPRLGVAERRLAAPAVGQHPEPLVDQALVPQRPERPHDALHVVEVEGLVVVVEVDPPGLAVDVALPLVGVAQHARAAGVVELGDPEGRDRRVAGDAQLLLGLDLGRQPVAVPAEAAGDDLPAHRAVARHGVLDEAGQQVAVVGQAVGERRAVVEHELVGALGLAAGDRLEERRLPLPALEDLLLEAGEVRAGVDGRVGPGGVGRWSGSVRSSLGSCARCSAPGRAAGSTPEDRGTTPLAPRLGGTPLASTGADGPDPFGSTGDRGRPVLPKARR